MSVAPLLLNADASAKPCLTKTHEECVAVAQQVANRLGIDFARERFNVHDLARGMKVEYEHGKILSAANCKHPDTNVTNDDDMATAKIALAHLYELRENPFRKEKQSQCGSNTQFDYYDGLEIVETAPVGYWRGVQPRGYWISKLIGFILVIVSFIGVIFLLIFNERAPLSKSAVRILLIALIVKSGFLIATWK